MGIKKYIVWSMLAIDWKQRDQVVTISRVMYFYNTILRLAAMASRVRGWLCGVVRDQALLPPDTGYSRR